MAKITFSDINIEDIKYRHDIMREPMSKISDSLGIERHTLKEWCSKKGYDTSRMTIPLFAKKNNILDIDLWLTKKYIDERLSGNDIARIIGVSGVAIYKYLNNIGVPMRNESEAFLNIPKENRAKIVQKMQEGSKRYQNSLSKEEKAILSQEKSERLNKYWANAGDEAHKRLSEACSGGARKRLANWSEEQKAECLKRLQAGHVKHYASLTIEEKRASMARAEKIFRDKYNSDPEYKAECVRKSLAAQNFRESKPERTIKQALVDHGYGDFEDQYQLGYYSIDIAYPDIKLAIEIDGEYWHSLPKVVQKDKSKNGYIQNYCGWNLLRIPATPCLKEPENMVWEIIQHIETIKQEEKYEVI